MFEWVKRILIGRAETRREKHSARPAKSKDVALREAFRKIKAEKQKNEARINKVFDKLNLYSNITATQNKKIDNIISEIAKIRESLKLSEPKIILKPRLIDESGRLNDQTRLIAQVCKTTDNGSKTVINIDSLTMQEKKILAALVENKTMPLSYQDIAALINKSPITIKTQLNKLKTKTNFIEEFKDSEGRKRHKIKDGFKIESFVGSD